MVMFIYFLFKTRKKDDQAVYTDKIYLHIISLFVRKKRQILTPTVFEKFSLHSAAKHSVYIAHCDTII
jgi:hypothetical protein